jgi:hypothetical protein
MAQGATLFEAYKSSPGVHRFINRGCLWREEEVLHKTHVSSEAFSRRYKEAVQRSNVRCTKLHVIHRANIEFSQSICVPNAVDTGTVQKIWNHVNIVDDQANNFRKEKWISYISMNNGSHHQVPSSDADSKQMQVDVAVGNPPFIFARRVAQGVD